MVPSINRLQALIGTCAVLGNVSSLSQAIKEYAAPLCSAVYSDLHGNVICRIGTGQPTLTLFCPIGQSGVMVTGIESSGAVRIGTVGGLGAKDLISRMIRVQTKQGSVCGVVGAKPVHLLTKEERKVLPKTKDLYLEFGCKSKEETQNAVQVGDIGTVVSEFCRYGEDMLCASGIEGYICAEAMLCIMEKMTNEKTECTVDFVFCSGIHGGVQSAMQKLQPKNVLLLSYIDAANCNGAGCVIPYADSEAVFDRAVCDRLHAIAEKTKQSVQVPKILKKDPLSYSGAIQRAGGGVSLGCLSLPVRFPYGGNASVRISDLACLCELAYTLIQSEF